MQKILAIFAHPDDESFGPGGFIAKKVQEGAIVHIVCATRGQAGNNGTGRDTSEVRVEELQNAARILGVQDVTFFDFTDGCICNSNIASLMKLITEKVESFRPDILLTFNLNGVSGHVDHMAVASAVTKVFDDTKIAQKLYYFTESKSLSEKMQHYFISPRDTGGRKSMKWLMSPVCTTKKLKPCVRISAKTVMSIYFWPTKKTNPARNTSWYEPLQSKGF
jgi:LmbE family N-acetylglucosaminyl deacetylase